MSQSQQLLESPMGEQLLRSFYPQGPAGARDAYGPNFRDILINLLSGDSSSHGALLKNPCCG
jgi:hypothetical protein